MIDYQYAHGIAQVELTKAKAEIDRLQREIEVLGDACRRRNERVDRLTAENQKLKEAVAGIIKHMDANGMGAWPVAQKAKRVLEQTGN
jgi:uncharacterized protein (UPF0335 family)